MNCPFSRIRENSNSLNLLEFVKNEELWPDNITGLVDAINLFGLAFSFDYFMQSLSHPSVCARTIDAS
jgi:hypothetical protein